MAVFDKRKAVQAALAFTQQRRFDKAIAEYKNALSFDPQDLTICKKLGDLYAQTGAIQEAITTYMKLGDLYRADGLAVKAIAIYKMVLNLDPKNMQIYLACADLYAEQGLVGEAKIQYMTVAEHYTRGGETRKALEVFERIANLDPMNFSVVAKVGEMYEKEKLPGQAVTHYVAAAKAAARAGNTREATECYNRALRLQPQAFEPLLGLGRLHFEAGKFREATTALEAAAAAAPEHPLPLALLGQCYRKLAAPEKAEASLRRAVQADPAATEPRIELARCLLDVARPDDAWEEFAAAADQLLQEGRGDEALEVVQGLAAEGLAGPKVLAKIVEIHQRLGREQEVREGQRRLADAYEEEGRSGEAAAVYRSLLEAFPDDPTIQARLQALGEADLLEDTSAGPPPAGDAIILPETDELAEMVEPAPPRVISIATAAESPADEISGLSAAEEDIGLFGGESPEGTAGLALEEDASEVAEQLAEADVYLKYGLIEKAAERLRETLADVPGNLAARARLRKLFVDEGRIAEATAETLALADALVARGQADRAVAELEALRRTQPEHAEIQARLERLRSGAASPPAAAKAPEAVDLLDEALGAEAATLGAQPAPRVMEPPQAAEISSTFPPGPAVESAGPPAASIEGAEEDLLDLSSFLRLGGQEGGEAVASLEAEEGEEFRLDIEETGGQGPDALRFDLEAAGAGGDLSLDLREAVGEDAVHALRFEPETPAEPSTEEAPAVHLALGRTEEDLEEADFFRTQGMVAEAGVLYTHILERDPGNARAQAGLAALRPELVAPETQADESLTLEEPLAVTGGESAPVSGAAEIFFGLEEGPGVVPAEPATRAEAEGFLAAGPPAETLPEVSSGAAAIHDDTWIPGPGPFALEEAQDLEMAPVAVPLSAEDTGPGVDLLDLDLPLSPEADTAPTLSPASLETIEPLLPAETAPAPPVPAPERLSTLEAAPDLPPATWRLAVSDQVSEVAPPPPAPSPRRIGPAEEIPVFRVAKPSDEPSAGFVDLGAEILKEMDVASRGDTASEGAALLSELLDEFQKGVRQHLDVEDYETHYNLGFAYREMDLFDEAIEEFRLAGKDSARALTCSGLIALCLLAKGQTQGAIEELTRALALPGYTPEQYHSLRYDLATAFEAAGQESLALELLEALAVSAPAFRDTTGRLAALRDRQGKPAPTLEAAAPSSRTGVAPGGDDEGPSRPGGPPRAAGPSKPAPAAPAPAADEVPPEAPGKKPARPRRDKISFV